MTASIIAFPLLNAFSRSDRTELSRWSAAAAQHRWFLKATLDRPSGGWVAVGAAGAEHVAVAYGHPGNPPDFLVQPRRGRWEIQAGDGASEGTFRTLRLALETICPTLPCSSPAADHSSERVGKVAKAPTRVMSLALFRKSQA